MYRSLLGLVLAVFQVAQGVLPLPTQDQRLELFGDYLESLRAQANIPGLSAAVVGENDIVWERAFGHQDLERFVATRTDTPFHLDGLTQLFTSVLVLQCAEDGGLSLDDRMVEFDPHHADPNATVRQLLSHTSGAFDNLTFAYRTAALAPLSSALARCNESFRESVAEDLFDRLAMIDSVPGPDVIQLEPPFDDLDASSVERYGDVLGRLATPYAINRFGQASPSQSSATTLTPASGVISTVRDLARFDVALRKGALLHADTLAAAWRVSVDRNGLPLPHGLGWFVQTYKGEKVVWQFGVGDNASSSLIMTVPAREFSVILLANSDGLVNPFALADGDLAASPFGRLFLGTFFR
jgi:CubicO group peptidase (beta-lactamase class C family)